MIHELGFPETEEFKLPNLYLSKCQHYSQTNPLFSYFCGLYSIQIVLTLLGGISHSHSVEMSITKLLEYLEDVKKTKIPKNLDSSFKLRQDFAKLLDKKYHNLTSIINQNCSNSKQVNFGQIVDLLLELAFLYEVLRGLYPVDSFKDESQVKALKKECSDEVVEYRIHYCKTQAQSILSIIKLGQDPNEFLSQLRIVPVDLDQDDDPDIGKAQVEDMIKQVMELPDDVLEDTGSEENSKTDSSDEEKEDADKGKGAWSHQNIAPSKKADVSMLVSPPKTEVSDTVRETKQENLNDISTAKPDPGPGDDNSYERKKEDLPAAVSSPSLSPSKRHIPLFTHKKPIHYSQTEMKAIMDKDSLLDLAMKEAKHAVSALNYEDTETALKKLEEAIRLVKEYDIKDE